MGKATREAYGNALARIHLKMFALNVSLM